MRDLVQTIMTWVHQTLNLHPQIQTDLLRTIGWLFFLWATRFVLAQIINRQFKDVRLHYQWVKALNYLVSFLTIIILSAIWIENIQSLATYFGLLSAGLAIALKDPVVNMIGWLFIILRRPFEVGDRVQVGPHTGDVIDLRLFQFTLLEVGNWVSADQSTGRLLHIPNGTVFTETLANFTEGFDYIWHEIPVLVTFESDWQHAKTILTEIINHRAGNISAEAKKWVQRASKRFMLVYPTLTPIVYTKVKENGVLLTIRYLTHPRKRRGTENDIWEDILKAFAQVPNIDFAYPTQRFYTAPQKPSTPVEATDSH